MAKLRDMSPRIVKKYLSKLNRDLPRLSGEAAHDKLINILVRAMYDRDGNGDFLWAHDLAIVHKIISKKPEIRKHAYEWFCGVKPKRKKKK